MTLAISTEGFVMGRPLPMTLALSTEGLVTPAATSIEQVYAVSTNEVFVEASSPLLQRSDVLVGDSQNPASWKIIRLDTGEAVPVIEVEIQSTSTLLLRTLFPLPTTQVQLELTAPTLLDSLGLAVDTSAIGPFSGMTEGAYATPQATATTRTTSARDLLNRPAPTVGGSGSVSGTLVIVGGDYKNQQGTSLIEKLIIRRLTTIPGDFLHLPGYGCGLRAKQAIPAGDLVRLQATIKQQIQQEREVDTVNVVLSMTQNTLFVDLAVTLKATGSKITMSVPFALNGGPQ